MKFVRMLTLSVTTVALGTTLAIAQDVMPAEDSFEAPKREYSPFVNDHFPNRPLFGETHVHTALSMDVGGFGNRLGMARFDTIQK